MSIGFTIPVIMICRGPVSDARTIGMIIVCFGRPKNCTVRCDAFQNQLMADGTLAQC